MAAQLVEHGHGRVVLVPDFADEFLDDVLDGDDAGHAAVAVDDGGHLQFVALHVLEDDGHLGGAVHVADGLEDRLELELRILHVGVVEILGVDQADEVVLLQIVHGQAREGVGREEPVDFGVAVRNVAGDHVDAGREDFLDAHIVEFDGGLDQVPFVAVDGAARLDFVHHDLELRFRDALGRLLAGDAAAQGLLQLVEEEVDRRKDAGQEKQGRAGPQKNLFGEFLGEALRRDFAENQDDDRRDDGRHGHAFGAHELDEDHRGDGRGSDVDDVVAHEDRREDGIEVVQQLQAQLGPGVPFAGHVFEADLVHARKGRFGRRKEGRTAQQREQGDDIDSKSSVFHTDFLSFDYFQYKENTGFRQLSGKMSNVTLSAKKEEDCPYPFHKELTFTCEIVILGSSIENLHRIKAMTGKRYGLQGFREPVVGANRQRQPYG